MSDQDGLAIFRRGQEVGDAGEIAVKLPAVVLIDPKYPHNVGQAVRLCSCYGIPQLWTSGQRVSLKAEPGFRLPREERMRGYADVTLVNVPDPLGRILGLRPDAVPVAVEVRDNAERLDAFQHPGFDPNWIDPTGVYVFGPEDGSLGGQHLKRCHRFIYIRTRHCLNLATAVGTVLYDMSAKGWHDA